MPRGAVTVTYQIHRCVCAERTSSTVTVSSTLYRSFYSSHYLSYHSFSLLTPFLYSIPNLSYLPSFLRMSLSSLLLPPSLSLPPFPSVPCHPFLSSLSPPPPTQRGALPAPRLYSPQRGMERPSVLFLHTELQALRELYGFLPFRGDLLSCNLTVER